MATIIENYTTKIAATKTASEIQELLAKHGVQKIMLEYSAGQPVGVSFLATTEWGEQAFRLPVDVDAMHQLLRATGRLKQRLELRKVLAARAVGHFLCRLLFHT